MLQNIRDKSQGWITWVIVIVVCFSFGLWGVHNYMGTGSTETVVADVNGIPIYQREVANLQRTALENLKATQGQDIDVSESMQMQIQKEALEQLITMQVALQGAIKEKFSVSNNQIYQIIGQMPYFQENGQFSQDRFRQVLRMMNQTEHEYIDNVRAAILVEQVRQSIVDSDFALANELNAAVALLEQKRSVDYFIIPASHFNNVAIPEEAVKQYYAEHKDSYQTAEKVSLSYIELTKADVAKQLNLPETDGNVEKAFATKSEELTNKSYENPDSLETASKAVGMPVQNSAEISKDTAPNKASVFANPNVLKAAFSDEVLNQGYNSDVITLDNGDQIVLRVNKHVAQKVKSFDEAKAQIEQQLKALKSKEELVAFSDKLSKEITSRQAATEIAKSNGFKLEQKDNVGRENAELTAPMIATLFKLPVPAKDKVSVGGVLLPTGDYAMLVLTDIKSGDPKSLTAEQTQIYRKQQAEQNGIYDYEFYLKSLKDSSKIKLNTGE